MDTELVVRAQAGDPGAFTELVDAMGGRLHAVACSILRDRDAAADATQRALMEAWRGLPGLRDPQRFEAWTYRLVVRACHAEARRAPRWMPLDPMLEQVMAGSPDPARAVGDRDQLERGFRRLSVDQRAVVVLRQLLDLPPDHVAIALGVPVGTVHSRLSRAMAALRAALDADDRPPTPPTPAVGGHVTVEVRR
jgi:RNA polymerase sigma-70 factor (ECF subfamily)